MEYNIIGYILFLLVQASETYKVKRHPLYATILKNKTPTGDMK